MSESDLHDLLHGVVPEAPLVDPTCLAARGRMSRNRRRGAFACATVAVVLAIGIPFALWGAGPGREAAPVLSFDPAPSHVYTEIPCTHRLRNPDRARTTMPDLSRITGLRLCASNSRRGVDGDSVVFRGVWPGSPDALLGDVASFARAVTALPASPRDTCPNADGVSLPRTLALRLDDGSVYPLEVGTFCRTVRLDGRRVAMAGVTDAFLDALDRQRDSSSYGVRLAPLTCRTPPTLSPARPGREQVVDAVVCDGGDRIEGDALTRLRQAWGDPHPVTQRLNDRGENECTELDTEPRRVLLATDRGDVVSSFESPCGYLVLDGWRPGESTVIPVTLAELES